MATGPRPAPRAEAEAFRQGRPPKPDLSERLLHALGLESARSRRFRRRWLRLRAYIIVGAIGAGAMLAALARLLGR